MWLRSERRERRLRRGANVRGLSLVLIKKTSQTQKSIKNVSSTSIGTKQKKIEKYKCNNITKPVIRKSDRKLRSRKNDESNNARKLSSDDCKENCWLNPNDDVTLFDSDSNCSANIVEKIKFDKENKNDINNYPTDTLNLVLNFEGCTQLYNNSNKDSTIISSCCSCDAEGLSSSKHQTTTIETTFNNANLIKCISECDSTTGFDSDGNNLTNVSDTDVDDIRTNEILDVIVPEVDSTTDITSYGESSHCPKRNRDLPKLMLPSSHYHDFPTPDLTPSTKQFPCYNSFSNNYSSTPDLISLFDEEINKNTPEIVNQYACNDYTSYDMTFYDGEKICSPPITLALDQTTIDSLKALTNFQTQSNFLSNITLPKKPETEISYYPTFQPAIEEPTINKDETTSDCRLETEEYMDYDEIDRRKVMSWNTFDPYVFIKHLPPLTCEMRAKCPALPLKTRSSPEFTLVLDLDETLVHCSLQELSDASFKFPVIFQDCKYTVFVRTRPFFREFLERVSQLFEVILFTASKRVYADKLLNLLDSERKWIKYRLFREHCVLVNGNYIKDLTILGRDLSKTIIIDNSPQAFGYQLENGIPIESWFMDQSDTELMKILPFLEDLAKLKRDVRPQIREKYRLYSYLPPD